MPWVKRREGPEPRRGETSHRILPERRRRESTRAHGASRGSAGRNRSKPRKGRKRATAVARSRSSFAPPGLDRVPPQYPRLTPWTTVLLRLRRFTALAPRVAWWSATAERSRTRLPLGRSTSKHIHADRKHRCSGAIGRSADAAFHGLLLRGRVRAFRSWALVLSRRRSSEGLARTLPGPSSQI